MKLPSQKPLGLRVRGDDDLAGFVAADGVVESIKATVLASEGAFGCVFVYGEEGSGKTHLLNGIARTALSQGRNLFFLDIDEPAEWGSIADDLAPGTLVICDGVDAGKARSCDGTATAGGDLEILAGQHKTTAVSRNAANSALSALAADRRSTSASTPAADQNPSSTTEQKLALAANQNSTLVADQQLALAADQNPTPTANQNPTPTANQKLALAADQSRSLTAEQSPTPTANQNPTLAAAQTSALAAGRSQSLITDQNSASGADTGAAVEIMPAKPKVANDASVSLSAQDREAGLWILYLCAEARGLRLLLSARTSPRQTTTRPELASRLAGQLVVALNRLDGDGLRKMVFSKLARRGLRSSDLALDYLLNHGSRETKKLDYIVAAVDELCQTRRSANVTIPILKQILDQS